MPSMLSSPRYPQCTGEAMARHKGSVFGGLGEDAQPSSEQLRTGRGQLTIHQLVVVNG